jgi:NAD(P)-dependent dehydrogenase (short-subunit alcohol dehydrogenase family)
MSNKLEGKIAGGSADIGLGAAKEFAAEGARVFITGRRQAELDRAVAEIGYDAIGIQGDASKVPDIKRIYDTVKGRPHRCRLR